MNKERRLAIENVLNQLYDLQTAVEELSNEECESLDNIPDNLQETKRALASREAVDNLNEAYDCLMEATGRLEDAMAETD